MGKGEVAVSSIRDDRDIPLYPVVCGDTGAVVSFPVECYVKCQRQGGSARVQEWDSRWHMWRWVDRPWYFTWWQLDKVPYQFLRLGPTSRKLVMSFYRALIERFWIMSTTGNAATRCFTVEDWQRSRLRRLPCHDSMVCGREDDILKLMAANDAECKQDFAGKNRRRAFGGTFRRALNSFFHLYRPEFECVHCGASVLLYPITPFGRFPVVPSAFMPCARDYSGSTTAISWWSSNTTWKNVFVRQVGNECYEVPWLYDQTMQPLNSYIYPNQCRTPSRPLLTDFAQAYKGAGFPCADAFVAYAAQRRAADRGLPEDNLRAFGACTKLACSVDIGSNPDALSIASFIPVWYGGRDVHGIVWDCRPTRNYNLPALALALRMLSIVNAQTIKRPWQYKIPHVKIRASRVQGFASDGSLLPERSQLTICSLCYSCIVVEATLGYGTGSVGGYPAGDVYVRTWCRHRPEEEPEGADFCCPFSCYQQWAWKFVPTGGGSTFGGVCASVDFSAVWPDWSKAATQVPTFCGDAYPARWAVREGDVAFGAVSAFVTGWDDKRAWVSSMTSDASATLGSCVDLMNVLVRNMYSAVAAAIMHESGVYCANTFTGTDYPLTESAIWREMVSDRLAANRALINSVVEARRTLKCSPSSSGLFTTYHHLKYCSCRFYGVREHCGSTLLCPLDYEGGSYSTEWLKIAQVYAGTSVDFSYQYNYKRAQDANGFPAFEIDSYARDAWYVQRRSARFGGFFGTFVFNNRSARQT